jgi:hypothetical protein
MQARERTTLIRQMLTGTSYGLATVWRCVLGLALVIVVTLHGTYQTPVRDAALKAAETKQLTALDDARAAANRKELLDDARAPAHRKELFDARRLRFQRVAASAAGSSA